MNWSLGFSSLLTAAVLFSSWLWSPFIKHQESTPTFRADVRLVEVYATVLDRKGRHVAGLPQEAFEVYDNGISQRIVSFQSSGDELSCALLLDMTGSMAEALPAVKNATISLINGLRDADWIAVYGFNTSLRLLQDFTRDKEAAKRVVMRIRPAGGTALFDAISQVALDLSIRKGKRIVIVFTDGNDNSSFLNAEAAIARARRVGLPVHTVAQGDALKSRALLEKLSELSQATYGLGFVARRSRDIEDIFAAISKDVTNTYMLAYAPPQAGGAKWRSIEVAVKDPRGMKVRAKKGYTPN
ncbi:MAG TPA: VWA domain-containing protein [Acidobacteriota bacterium]|nr:VWA domain-containing protein [Acidobacteriota bacterium]